MLVAVEVLAAARCAPGPKRTIRSSLNGCELRKIDGSLPSGPTSFGFHDSSTVPPVTVTIRQANGRAGRGRAGQASAETAIRKTAAPPARHQPAATGGGKLSADDASRVTFGFRIERSSVGAVMAWSRRPLPARYGDIEKDNCPRSPR